MRCPLFVRKQGDPVMIPASRLRPKGQMKPYPLKLDALLTKPGEICCLCMYNRNFYPVSAVQQVCY